ncbi:MAG TPA: SRPBCC domain-containing protein, partial [Anaerolineales bacterium]|nr:SRPBCC domain-containing protein [Anaerolineales bacterium]
QAGEYVEVISGEKLSYTWTVAEGSVPTLVTFLLKETNGETTVDLDHSTSHEGADEKKLHDGHANQWGFFLMNLKGYLEAGMDLRKEKLNQITT